MNRHLIRRLNSIEHKLLFAFAAFLLVVTVLNAGLTSFLINSGGKSEALSRLSRQLQIFKVDLQTARETLLAVATNAARDEKTLSDMAILYSQTLKLAKEPGESLQFSLGLDKAASLDRLQLILLSARISATAVYVNGALSHYITGDEVGMVMPREGTSPLRVARQKNGERLKLDDWWNWSEAKPPEHIPRILSAVRGVSVDYVFQGNNALVMRVTVPIQGTLRQSFGDTIVESLAIGQPADTMAARDGKAEVVGMLMFTKVIGSAFLEQVAVKSSMSPAIFSADGTRSAQPVGMDMPAPAAPQADGMPVLAQTLTLGSESYYQAYLPWTDPAGVTPLVLSLATSREGTVSTIRHTIVTTMLATVAILVLGGVLGYVLIARLVTPIKTLAASVAREVGSLDGHAVPGPQHAPDPGQVADINIGAGDEVTQLTNAFNLMTERLHQSFALLEQRVVERTTELAKTNKELESFSYSVSHDLRAPLRHIDGFLTLLKENAGHTLDEKSLQHIAKISKATRRMSTLIDDLLSFSRMGRQDLSKTSVDLGDLVAEVIRELATETEGRDVEWLIGDLPTVTGDRAMLGVALFNLISNALKFTSKRPLARIEVGVEAVAGGEIVFFVRDNGVGFDMKYRDKLFGVFQRLHRMDQFEGTGIGLAIVFRVIDRHGGRTWAEGELDQGAAFYFTLPQPQQLPPHS